MHSRLAATSLMIILALAAVPALAGAPQAPAIVAPQLSATDMAAASALDALLAPPAASFTPAPPETPKPLPASGWGVCSLNCALCHLDSPATCPRGTGICGTSCQQP